MSQSHRWNQKLFILSERTIITIPRNAAVPILQTSTQRHLRSSAHSLQRLGFPLRRIPPSTTAALWLLCFDDRARASDLRTKSSIPDVVKFAGTLSPSSRLRFFETRVDATSLIRDRD